MAYSDVSCVKIGAGVLDMGDLKNPRDRKSRVNKSMCEIGIHVQKQNPSSNL